MDVFNALLHPQAFGLFCALLAICGPVNGRNDFMYAYYRLTCVENADELANSTKVGPGKPEGDEKAKFTKITSI